jgi:hypothetical protein
MTPKSLPKQQRILRMGKGGYPGQSRKEILALPRSPLLQQLLQEPLRAELSPEPRAELSPEEPFLATD